MIDALIEHIRGILTANQLLQEVYTYEASDFKGDPVAVITPSSNESDYKTSNSNERIYAFSVKLFVARKDRDDTGKKADAVLRELLDSVLNDFDRNYLFTSIQNVPVGYTMINVFAVPSQWGYAGREDEYRVSEVSIRCRVYVDITNV